MNEIVVKSWFGE